MERVMKCFILIIVVKHAVNLDIIIQKSDTYNDPDFEHLSSLINKTYEIPLFQIRYMNMRVHLNKFRQNRNVTNVNLIGMKFQVKSNNIHVVDVEKSTVINNSNSVLLEDLFILPSKNALDHIFNAYPSPTLMNLNENIDTIDIRWSIRTKIMDTTNLTFVFDIFYDDESLVSYNWSLNILVGQPERIMDKIFYVTLPILAIFISIQMGILLDAKIILELVRNPKPVMIGFITQYGFMPFLAVAIAKVCHYSTLYSLALFVVGCCPGSGASNQWTLLFDGDVNLSALMSFVSMISSFVIMPIYFYTIGRMYMDDLSIPVPFLGLIQSLSIVVVPYGIGIIISYYSPKIRSLVEDLVKPMMLFLLLFFLIFGTTVNWHLIKTIDLYTILTAPLLPYFGFLLGALFAWTCGLNWSYIKTIGIEAGMQNIGIAFMIIFYSFPRPHGTQAIVVPLAISFLTTQPLWIIYIIRNRINRYKKKKSSINDVENKAKSDIVEMMQNL